MVPSMSELRASLDWRDPLIHYPSSIDSVDSIDSVESNQTYISSVADSLLDLPSLPECSPKLAALPSEILELIAFELGCLDRYDVPSDLLSFSLVSKHFYRVASPQHNPRLYARLFKDRFDVAAVKRRFAPLRTRVLAKELLRRLRVMSQMKRCVEHKRLLAATEGQVQEQMLEALWISYLMMLEHDQKNLDQLYHHAQLPAYLELHYKTRMLPGAVEPGFPPETVDRALATHLHYFLMSEQKLDDEALFDPAAADEKFFVLKPYVFAAQKYSAYFADWTLKQLPSLAGPPQSIAHQAVHLQYFDRTITLRPPVLFHAACLNFSLRADRDPEISGAGASADGNDGYPFGDLSSSPRDARDFRFRPARDEVDDEDDDETVSTANLLRALSARTPQTPLPKLGSHLHDFDFLRLTRCHATTSSPGLTVSELRGTLKGTWEGRFSFFDFDAYREMLNGSVRSLYTGPFRAQPQVWKIEEVVVKLSPGDEAGGPGSVLNAGFRQGQVPTFAGMRTYPDPLRIRESLDAAKMRDTLVTVGEDEPLDPNCHYEILLTGSGHSAWGQFVLHGRIRTWDGLFTVAKEYTPDGRGRWLYRGYALNGGSTLVGRWRDTFSPTDVAGYEGNFVMSKRVAE